MKLTPAPERPRVELGRTVAGPPPGPAPMKLTPAPERPRVELGRTVAGPPPGPPPPMKLTPPPERYEPHAHNVQYRFTEAVRRTRESDAREAAVALAADQPAGLPWDDRRSGSRETARERRTIPRADRPRERVPSRHRHGAHRSRDGHRRRGETPPIAHAARPSERAAVSHNGRREGHSASSSTNCCPTKSARSRPSPSLKRRPRSPRRPPRRRLSSPRQRPTGAPARDRAGPRSHQARPRRDRDDDRRTGGERARGRGRAGRRIGLRETHDICRQRAARRRSSRARSSRRRSASPPACSAASRRASDVEQPARPAGGPPPARAARGPRGCRGGGRGSPRARPGPRPPRRRRRPRSSSWARA